MLLNLGNTMDKFTFVSGTIYIDIIGGVYIYLGRTENKKYIFIRVLTVEFIDKGSNNVEIRDEAYMKDLILEYSLRLLKDKPEMYKIENLCEFYIPPNFFNKFSINVLSRQEIMKYMAKSKLLYGASVPTLLV